MPVLILSMKGSEERRPAIVFLHSTHKNKEWLRPLLKVVNQIVFFAVLQCLLVSSYREDHDCCIFCFACFRHMLRGDMLQLRLTLATMGNEPAI